MIESLLGLLFILGFPLWLAVEEVIRLHAEDVDRQAVGRRVPQESR